MRLRSVATSILVIWLSVAGAANEIDIRERESVADDLSPAVGSVMPGRRLTKLVLRDKYDRKIGRVEDLMIDPYYGRVSSLVIKPDGKIDRERRLIVPLELVAPIKSKYLRASVVAAEIEEHATSMTERGSRPYTRTLALATFRHYGLKPYWEDGERQRVEHQDRLVTLSDLRDVAVRSPEGDKLGNIDDVLVSQKDGTIVYTLFRHQHEEDGKTETKTFPIPLAVFVVPPKSNDWTLEFSEELLDGTEIVKGAAYPKEISRRWVEYIHVRYGGGVFSGVQRELKTDK